MKSVFMALGLDPEEIMQKTKDFFDHIKRLTEMIHENNEMLKAYVRFAKMVDENNKMLKILCEKLEPIEIERVEEDAV